MFHDDKALEDRKNSIIGVYSVEERVNWHSAYIF